MKISQLVLASIVLAFGNVFGIESPKIVVDPIADYITRHKDDLRAESEKNEHIVKIEVDLDNDGRKDLFLSREKSAILSEEYENKVYVWDLYRKLQDGRYELINTEKSKNDDGSTNFIESEFIFDPTKFYVGYISENKAYGMLVTYYINKHNGVELSTYVAHGDYFEKLNFPNENKPVVVYHRDDTDKIPDLPDAAQHYVDHPPAEKMVIVP